MDPFVALPWLALSQVSGVGRRRFALLIQVFGHPAKALDANPAQLQTALKNMAAVDAVVAAGLRWRGRFDRDAALVAEAEKAARCGAQVLALGTPEYPEWLAHIPDPPPYLYRRGRGAAGELPGSGPAVAIVGSRRATGYGRTVAERFASDLAAHGVTVVSGLARGIDGAAHRGALKAGGRTVAVLGSGVDVPYPPEHRGLFEEILAEGAVLSELPPGAQPEPQHFPERNRIISGLCRSIVVVEAAERSGALITADSALDQGRDVFAVPGNVTSPMSRGTNRLLSEGAMVAASVEDVLAELYPAWLSPRSQAAQPPRQPANGATPELRVLELLEGEPIAVDQLIAASGLSAPAVQSALLMLELRGAVVALPGARYIRSL